MSKKTFKGGVHPLKHEGKRQTRDIPVRDYIPDVVTIPMSMHLGAPSKPCVQKGDHVKIGQLIGEPQGGLGLPVHASISGEVIGIENRVQTGALPVTCITIESDNKSEWVELFPLGDVETADTTQFVNAVKNAGICGMGGATFPTHVKLTIPEGKTCDTIIINGAECETYLTSDFRLMLETPKQVIDGLRAVMRALDVSRGVICIEDNKPEAIHSMKEAAAGRKGIEVQTLKTKYPQGSEKQLIKSVTGREVKRGALPIDAHTIVLNTATAAAIAEAITTGKPLVSRITTVTGAVNKPANLRVPIGTLVSALIGVCDGYSAQPAKILMGGGMTAPCAYDDVISITKGAGGVVVIDKKHAYIAEESPCIRCGRCVHVCPMGLRPYEIKSACDALDMEAAKNNKVMDCIVCGCCSFVCPASRDLTPSFKLMKDKIAAAARRAKK